MIQLNKSAFHIYRYQIIPLSQQTPLFWDIDVNSLDELKERKNEFFRKAFLKIKKMIYSRADLIHKIILDFDDILAMIIGVNRALNHNKSDFTQEKIEDWPSFLVVFNNEPDIQKIAIQLNRKAFAESGTIANFIEETVNNYLSNYHLKTHLKPMFTTRDFWDIVDKHPEDITQAVFRMVSPNMSNISKSLSLDLKLLNQTTNTDETTLELNSDKSSFLSLDRGNDFIGSLVDYASEGGGDIALKIKGAKGKVHTRDSITEYELDEVQIKNATPEELAHVFKGLLN